MKGLSISGASAPKESDMAYSILRLPEVIARTGLSRSTIYVRISKGLWPKPITLGARAVGWPAEEIEALNRARAAGKTNDEIRYLIEWFEAIRISNDEVV